MSDMKRGLAFPISFNPDTLSLSREGSGIFIQRPSVSPRRAVLTGLER